MINTTRWQDLKVNDLNEVLEKIKDNNNKDLPPNRRKNGETFFDFKVDVITSGIEKIKMLNEEISYFSVKASYYLLNKDKDTQIPYHLLLIAYKKEDKIYYIINRNYDATKILRRILSITENNALGEKKVKITDYMSFWIVQCIYNKKNFLTYSKNDYDNIDITMDKMIGIKGSTPQENKLMAQGTTIGKLISTLSLLLEIDSLQETQIEISTEDHEQIILALHSKDGRVGTDINSYNGKYEDESKGKKSTKLLLLLYLEIIPIIKANYVAEEEKNNDETRKFISQIVNILIKKLNKIKNSKNSK